MDLSMIDAGVLGGQVELGDEVVIIGEQGDDRITLEEVAAAAGTVIEHTLTQLSARPSRVYLGG
jgi:alanine racemase